MFKRLFREVFTPTIDVKANNKLVEEIHNAFNIDSENALKEAQEILKCIQISDKGDLLSKLGFINTPEAIKNNEERSKQIDSQRLAKIIQEYHQVYPLYKFITEEGVEKICKKYGLVFGDISRYRGNVPEKNLLEIQAFNEWKKEGLKLEHKEAIVSPMMGSKYTKRLSDKPSEKYLRKTIGYTYERWSENTQYSICAPSKDMNMDKQELKNDWKLQDIPDPVVLYPVIDGFLVVSKWGLEASDSELINTINN